MFQTYKVTFLVLGFLSFALTNCAEEKKNDLAVLSIVFSKHGSLGEIKEIPQPTLDTVTLILDDTSIELLNQEECKTGNLGIIVSKDAGSVTPILNIHLIDMSKNSGIFLETQTPTTGSHMDLDHTDGETYNVVQDCPATVMENTPQIYDLQVLNCKIADQFGGGSNQKNMSFRVRCTKG
ncbi:hypothetical protein [Leptospira sarikeiensis]|uniref:Lipoprotein n=1 Tax=Leptospira sarikeiensis TaxID=2484943 RepID=A0A4R9K4Q8_9LEPT|nr:hypothetical protein [Leptospira sarikeiensis]TGL60463.1 hypothetical protein EHQ64_11520 [Leptospira sarikeiensis]